MIRYAPLDEEPGQEMQDIVAPELAGDQDRQALPSVLVDHRQHPEDPPIILNPAVAPVGADGKSL